MNKDLNTMTMDEKWAELGKQYVLIEQTQNNIAMLKQALAKKEEPILDKPDNGG